jgi:hypothetical protein
MLFALLDSASTVDIPHLRAALAWWDYCCESVGVIFGHRTGDEVADRLRAEMPLAHAMTLTEIRNLFANHVPAARITEALNLLETMGEMWLGWRETGGRPARLAKRIERARS